MATVGTLAVNIVARTEKFTAGIGKSLSMLSRFSKGLAAATIKLTKFASAGALAAAGALTLLTKRQLDSIDAMAKVSDKLGINIESLSAFRLAAEEAGLSAQTFDTALQRMTRRIAEAGVGKGEALGALKELGLNPQLLASLAPDKQLERVADAMAKVRTQGDRVRLAMKLFDSEGVGVVNMLKGGSKALREYDAVARRLGLTISRELAAGVERANDALGRLKMAFVGLGRQLAVRVAPLIEHASKFMEKLLTDDGRIGKLADSITRGIGHAIKFVLDGIHRIRIAIAETMLEWKVAWFKFAESSLGKRMGLNFDAAGRQEFANEMVLDQLKIGGMKLQDPGRDFMAWYNKTLDRAMQQAAPAIEGKLKETFSGMLGRAGAAVGTARGALQQFLSDPFQGGRLGRLIAGAVGDKAPASMGQRGSLAFAVAGSAESYRQQAAIRRQNEPMMQIAKQQLKVQERIARAAEKQAEKHEDKVANF